MGLYIAYSIYPSNNFVFFFIETLFFIERVTSVETRVTLVSTDVTLGAKDDDYKSYFFMLHLKDTKLLEERIQRQEPVQHFCIAPEVGKLINLKKSNSRLICI